MFYSHEILTNHEHGVSTIWLVATIGNRSSTGRVSKKAIQGVNVQKACGKILQPGVPIALRLQGNLLYGVSRVYRQQCDYMLNDAQRVQSNLELYFKRAGSNQLDQDKAKPRPNQLVLEDDPDFVLEFRLPALDASLGMPYSQLTTKTTSQMSPVDSSLGSQSSGPGAFPINLDLSQSLTPDPKATHYLGLQGLSSAHKSHVMPGDEKMFALPNIEDEFGGIEDWGLDIDENGNIKGGDEPDLPPMFHAEPKSLSRPIVEGHNDDHLQQYQDDFVIMDEEALPDAPALPEHNHQDAQQPEGSASLSSAKAPAKRQRKAKTFMAEELTQVCRPEIRSWQDDYLENCGAKSLRPISAKQARDNAIHLTFGLGLGNIGQSTGVPGMIHPLAITYSGDSLYTTFTGYTIEPLRRKRRSTREPSDASDEHGRRVRPRLDGDGLEDDIGRHDADGQLIFDDDAGRPDSPLEIGRDAQAAMSDAPSSAMRPPWARGSSALPGSSAKGHGSAQHSRQRPVSPSHGGGNLFDIERFSDDANVGGGVGGAGWGGGLGSYDGGSSDMDHQHGQPGRSQEASHHTATAAEVDSREFLNQLEADIEMLGERLSDDGGGRKWLRFDRAFPPAETRRPAAARAFYNVLCAATRTQVVVRSGGGYASASGSADDIWVGMQ
ncbi:meiotic recombination protein REC8 [Microdochium nivale]|nr:meiotic recombination protein REC8 [Microdochium nivale]